MASVMDADLKNMTQEERVQALGMTTEQLTGRSMFIEFDPEATERFTYPMGAGRRFQQTDRNRYRRDDHDRGQCENPRPDE